MTTMDSDSESQDSDEGRRFRFETTRKDATTTQQSRRRDISPYNNTSRRRTRSRERTRYPRREEKKIPESTKDRTNDRNNYDERRNSKEKKSATSDSKKIKEVRNKTREPKKTYNKVSRDSQKRDSTCRETRIIKNRDDKRKRSRDRSRETKNRDKYRKYSRESDRLNQREKSSQRQKSCDEKMGNHDNKNKLNELSQKNHQEITHDPQDCKDLNLSDFDIVSDTEGNSDNFDEIIDTTNDDDDDDIERRKGNSMENDKVKYRNGDKSSGSYLSNHDDISDVLLASTSAKSISTNNSDNLMCKNDNVELKKLDIKSEPEKNCAAVDKYEDIDEEIYGPALPPIAQVKSFDAKKIIGPSLPEHLRKFINQDNNEDDNNQFGPALPPHLQKCEDENVEIGLLDADEVDDDGDDGVVGPLPVDHPTLKDDLVQQQLEYRAQLIKRELAEIDNIEEQKRDEWMIELPTVDGLNLGMGARKFRTRAGPDLSDRSDWTDTPADRAKKKRQHALSKTTVNNEQPEKIIQPEEPSKRAGKSLFEMHQKKLQAKKKKMEKEAKKSGKLPERRPFDRDIDLQVNRFDEARKNKMFMKAAALDDRFSSGKI